MSIRLTLPGLSQSAVDGCEEDRSDGLLDLLYDLSGAELKGAVVTSAGDSGARGGVCGFLGWVGWLPCPFVGDVIPYLTPDT